MKRNRSARRQRGSEILEFGLVFLPLMAVIFLILDIAWVTFARNTLQYAVREGVRYAVTSRVRPGLGHKESIRKVVQENALGFLAGESGRNKIHVRFYTPDTFRDISGTEGANAGGNLVEVSVEDVSWHVLAPLLRSNDALFLMARSADRMEASPASGPPAL